MLYLTLPGMTEEIEGPEGFKFEQSTTLGDIIVKLIPYLMAVAGIILFLMLVFGGFTMLTSAGNPDGVKKGQQMIVNSIIGFVIIFAAFWIMQVLQIIFGLNLGFGN